MTPICEHCHSTGVLVSGKAIYPHRQDLFKRKFWKCTKCDSYVGCHKHSNKPLGTMANEKLRKLRMSIHKEFDPIWKKTDISRTAAYKELANLMGIKRSMCHIALFNANDCYDASDAIWVMKQKRGL